MVEAVLFLDDSEGAFADGLESFKEGKKHDDEKFVGVVTTQEAEKEGKDEHSGAAPKASMKVVRIID